MIELQGKFGKDCKIFANTIENEAIGWNDTKHFEQSGYDWCSGSYYA